MVRTLGCDFIFHCSLSLCGKTTGCDPEELGSSPRDCTTMFKKSTEKALESYEGDSDAITVDIKYEASCEELARDVVKHLQDNHLPCSYRHVESYYDRDNDCPEQYQVYIKLR